LPIGRDLSVLPTAIGITSLTAATVPPTNRAITEGEMAGIISPIRHSDPAEVLSYGFTVLAWSSIATRPEARIAALWACVKTVTGSDSDERHFRSTRLSCRGDGGVVPEQTDRSASIKLSAIGLTSTRYDAGARLHRPKGQLELRRAAAQDNRSACRCVPKTTVCAVRTAETG